MDIFNPSSISSLFKEPEDKEQFNKWIEQAEVYSFLEQEIEDEHIILHASLPFAFITSVLIPKAEFNHDDIPDLLEWNIFSDATWGVACSADAVWLESPLANSDSELLRVREKIIFRRDFDALTPNRDYYELSQKLAHVLQIHFVPERNAWCKLNKFGDVVNVVKITEIESANGKRNESGGTIISIEKKALAKYATLTDSTFLKMFDFTRYKTGSFNGWHKGAEKPLDCKNISGRLVVESAYGSYTRGIQIANIKVEKQKLIDEAWGRRAEDKEE